jgi:hypothetical protein
MVIQCRNLYELAWTFVDDDHKWPKIDRYPYYRPCRPIRLREVKSPALLRQTANRWRQGCQPYAPAALYPQVSFLRILVLISVRGWVDPRAIVPQVTETSRKYEYIWKYGLSNILTKNLRSEQDAQVQYQANIVLSRSSLLEGFN